MRYFVALLVLLVAAGISWAEDQVILIARLQKAGCTIHRFQDGITLRLDDTNLTTCLPELCELKQLRYLGLNCRFTDTQLRTACSLPGLFGLNLDSSSVTDEQLKQVSQRLQPLEMLSLSNTQITDVGLEALSGMDALDRLYLDGTSVTDAGLRHVEKFRHLSKLDLNGCTGVTDEGVARLQKILPNCRIER